MKVRHKKTGEIGASGWFNMNSISEIYVYFNDEVTTDFQSEYDVFVEALGEWKDLCQAFHDHDVIVDNLNTRFFEPATDAERERGYRL